MRMDFYMSPILEKIPLALLRFIKKHNDRPVNFVSVRPAHFSQ